MAGFTQEINSDVLYQTLINGGVINTNTTTVGAIINKELSINFPYAYEFLMQSRVVTDGTFVLFLEESDDGITFVPVSFDYIVNNGNPGFPVTFVAGDNNLTRSEGYVGLKQYIRASIVSTGVTVGGDFSLTVEEIIHRHQPVPAQA
jgi:hypothetical protein